MADKSHFENPPQRLSSKVRKTGGPTPEQAILRALNAAEDLMDSYQGWAVDDLTSLWQAFEVSTSASDDAENITRMYDLTHDIRGEGGSFGFPLISIIGDSLCKFIEGKKSLKRTELEVVKVHILAMRAVFRQELKGAQPGLERELRQLLTLLRERIAGRI